MIYNICETYIYIEAATVFHWAYGDWRGLESIRLDPDSLGYDMGQTLNGTGGAK